MRCGGVLRNIAPLQSKARPLSEGFKFERIMEE